MQNLSIKLNTKEFEDSITGMKADMPWVIQNTINDLLKMAQDAQYKTMRKNFTIRNEAFLKYSVRIQFASRQSQTGALFIADLSGKHTSNIWETFEGGGTKTPTKGKYVAVPTDEAWPNKATIRPTRNKPRNLRNSFVVRHGANKLILNRIGKKGKSIQVMYVLRGAVRIPDKLHFYDTVLPVIENNYQSVIERLLTVSMQKRGFA